MPPLIILQPYQTFIQSISTESLVLADFPEMYYKMDDASSTTVTDSSGNGYHLTTKVGTVTAQQAGQIAKSFLYGADGVNYLAGSLPLGTSEIPTYITMNAWLYLSAYPSTNPAIIFEQQENSGYYNYRAQITTGGKLEISINCSTSGVSSVTSSASIPTGQFCMVTVVLIKNEAHFYINAVKDTNTGFLSGIGSDLVAANSRVGIGNDVFAANRSIDGYVDEVSVFTHPLTAARITEYYEAGNGTYYPGSLDLYYQTIFNSGPYTYWRLGELTADTIAADEMGNIAGSGTYQGSPIKEITSLIAGTVDTAVNMNGAGYIKETSIVSSADVPLGQTTEVGTFSIEMWIKPNTVGTTGHLYDQRNGGGTYSNGSFQFRSTGTLRFDKYLPSASWLDGNIVMEANNVYHVVYVETPSSRAFYVNGQLDVSDGSPETYGSGAMTQFAIGAIPHTGLNIFDGTIDEVAIYRKALSSTEVLEHYLTGRDSATASSYEVSVIEDFPIAYWRLDPTHDSYYFPATLNTSNTTQMLGASSPQGLVISSDGIKIFVCTGFGYVYQYSMANAWDVSSISGGTYYNTTGDGSGQGSSVGGIFFDSTGTRFYMLNTSSKKVYEYSCSTPWEVLSGMTYTGRSISVLNTFPGGIQISSDGTKMFIMDIVAETVYSYTLGTAWEIDTATYDSISYSFAAQTTNPSDIFVKPDGTSFFICDAGTNFAYEYTLSVAWDLSSTVTYANSTSIPGTSVGLTFKDDGTSMYVFRSARHLYHYYTNNITSTTVIDKMGSYPGTYTNGPTLRSPGVMSESTNMATFFDGDNDYVELGSISSSADLSLSGTSTFSIEAWVNPDLTGDDGMRIVDKSNGIDATNGYALYILNTGAVVLQVDNGNYLQTSAGAVSTGNKYHIVAMGNSSSYQIYINATQVASGITGGSYTTPPAVTTNMRIGTWNHDVAREFKGTIDEVAIYSYALKPQQIQDHYNAGTV